MVWLSLLLLLCTTIRILILLLLLSVLGGVLRRGLSIRWLVEPVAQTQELVSGLLQADLLGVQLVKVTQDRVDPVVVRREDEKVDQSADKHHLLL